MLVLAAALLALAVAEVGLRATGYGDVEGIEPNLSDPVLRYSQASSDDEP